MNQEQASLVKISDSFKKIIIVSGNATECIYLKDIYLYVEKPYIPEEHKEKSLWKN